MAKAVVKNWSSAGIKLEKSFISAETFPILCTCPVPQPKIHLVVCGIIVTLNYKALLNNKNRNMTLQNKRLFILPLSVVALLLIPFIAMQFTQEVNWTWFDFAVAGTLLTGTGLLCQLVIKKIRNRQYRFVICAVLIAALLIVWGELAAGIFGTPFAGH
jgi:peptidoglycan/LPS O-acetylase OafA/YrhL